MEKGFNDDELADIMNEIESLEKEFTEEVDSKQEEVEEEVSTNEEHIEPEMNEVSAAQESEEDEFEDIEEDSFSDEDFDDEIVDDRPILDDVDPLANSFDDEEEEVAVAMTEEASPVTVQEKHVLQEVVEMPVASVVPEKTVDHDFSASAPSEFKKPAAVMHNEGSTAQTSMTFNVEGDMKLSLSFNISGKCVQLCVNDNGLELEMDGGMKFSIPLENKNSFKKAA